MEYVRCVGLRCACLRMALTLLYVNVSAVAAAAAVAVAIIVIAAVVILLFLLLLLYILPINTRIVTHCSSIIHRSKSVWIRIRLACYREP